MTLLVYVLGGGDLASGVAARLYRSGFNIIITELSQPLAVRRSVSFAEAVYGGIIQVEDIKAQLVDSVDLAFKKTQQGIIPVLIDPRLETLKEANPNVIVDARMTKKTPSIDNCAADLVIGLGPGFIAQEHCHAVVETKRGHYLGRIFWEGTAEKDTGLPGSVKSHEAERVLRAPDDGVFKVLADIGTFVEAGQELADVDGKLVRAQFPGMIRGMLHDGLIVHKGMKVGDLDPRRDPKLHQYISEKALAIGGGVLEAILSTKELRPILWD